MVTGLVVNDRPGVPRDEVRRLRAILHRARTEGLESQNRENLPDFLAWLRGRSPSCDGSSGGRRSPAGRT